jgi:hypothetical protein
MNQSLARRIQEKLNALEKVSQARLPEDLLLKQIDPGHTPHKKQPRPPSGHSFSRSFTSTGNDWPRAPDDNAMNGFSPTRRRPESARNPPR